MNLHPYLFFTGHCEEAMHWYQSIFGGELDVLPYADGTPGVMHAHLHGGLVEFMASDITPTKPFGTSCISMGLFGTDDAVIRDAFSKLSADATEVVEIKTESWGDSFGSLTDKYGIDWLANISAE